MREGEREVERDRERSTDRRNTRPGNTEVENSVRRHQ